MENTVTLRDHFKRTNKRYFKKALDLCRSKKNPIKSGFFQSDGVLLATPQAAATLAVLIQAQKSIRRVSQIKLRTIAAQCFGLLVTRRGGLTPEMILEDPKVGYETFLSIQPSSGSTKVARSMSVGPPALS